MPLDHDPSFVALFVKNQRRIYGYILTLVPDCNEADDLFQQTSMVLWEKSGEFRPAKKGTGPICRNGPKAGTDAQRWSSHKLDLSPFSDLFRTVRKTSSAGDVASPTILSATGALRNGATGIVSATR